MILVLDITGGTNYVSMGTSQLMSVPYAFYAQTSGNVGATGATGATGVTGPSGGPVGPTGAVGPPTFDPDHTDGLDSATGVYLLLTGGTSYTVPAGKNFHAEFYPTSYPNNYSVINGDTINDFENWAILLPGTVLANLPPSALYVSGYLSPIYYQAVYHNLSNSSYTVPAGKTLFLYSLINNLQYSYFVNGVNVRATAALSNASRIAYMVVNSGSVVSTNAPAGSKVFLNGVLK